MTKPRLFKIQIISEEGLRIEYVEAESFYFGRSDKAEVQIASPKTSRKHLKVWSENGEVHIADQKSSLGTTLNGKPLTAQKAYRYRPGDTLQLGGYYGFITIHLVPHFERAILEEKNDPNFEGRVLNANVTQHLGGWIKEKISRSAQDSASEEERQIIIDRMSNEEQFKKRVDQMFNQTSAAIRKIEEQAKANVAALIAQAKSVSEKMENEAKEKLSASLESYKQEEVAKITDDLQSRRQQGIAQAEQEAERIREKGRQEIQQLKEDAIKEGERIRQSAQKEKEDMRRAIEEKAKAYYSEVIQKATDEGNVYKDRIRQQVDGVLIQARKKADDLIREAEKKAESTVKEAESQAKEAFQRKEELTKSAEKVQESLFSLQSSKDQLMKRIEVEASEIEEKGRANAEKIEAESKAQAEKQITNANRAAEKCIDEARAKAREIVEHGRQAHEEEKKDFALELQQLRQDCEKVKSELKTLNKKKQEAQKETEETIAHLAADRQTAEKEGVKASKEIERIKVQLDVLKSESATMKAQREAEFEELSKNVLKKQDELKALENSLKETVYDREQAEGKLSELMAARSAEEASAGKILSGAQAEAERIKKEMVENQSEHDRQLEKLKSATEAELRQLKEAAEKEIALKKVRELESAKQMALKEEKEFEKRKRIQAMELQRLLKQEVIKKVTQYIEAGGATAETQMAKDVERIVQMVMNNESPELESNIKNFEDYDPLSVERTRRYWRKSMVWGGLALMVVGLLVNYKSTIVSSAKNYYDAHFSPAAKEDVFVKQVQKIRDERPKFEPVMSADFKSSYTDNVLYTRNFVAFTLDESYQKEWIIHLNNFFVNKLKLSENAIAPFVAKETSLVNKLSEIRETINPMFLEESIERMRTTESEATSDLIKTVGGTKKWKRFFKFKKKFFEGYQPERLPTADSAGDGVE